MEGKVSARDASGGPVAPVARKSRFSGAGGPARLAGAAGVGRDSSEVRSSSWTGRSTATPTGRGGGASALGGSSSFRTTSSPETAPSLEGDGRRSPLSGDPEDAAGISTRTGECPGPAGGDVAALSRGVGASLSRGGGAGAEHPITARRRAAPGGFTFSRVFSIPGKLYPLRLFEEPAQQARSFRSATPGGSFASSMSMFGMPSSIA